MLMYGPEWERGKKHFVGPSQGVFFSSLSCSGRPTTRRTITVLHVLEPTQAHGKLAIFMFCLKEAEKEKLKFSWGWRTFLSMKNIVIFHLITVGQISPLKYLLKRRRAGRKRRRRNTLYFSKNIFSSAIIFPYIDFSTKHKKLKYQLS